VLNLVAAPDLGPFETAAQFAVNRESSWRWGLMPCSRGKRLHWRTEDDYCGRL